MTMERKELLTPKEWGQKHGVPHNTVLNWIKRNWILGTVKTKLPSGGYHYSIPADAPKPVLKKPGPKPKKGPLDSHTWVTVLEELRKQVGTKLSNEDIELIANNHATRFFDLAQQASPKLIGAEANAWLDRLEHEYNNLRIALDYYASKDAGTARELELAVLMSAFWEIRGHWSEGRERLRHALSRQPDGASPLKAKALAWLGYLAFRQNEYARAAQASSESVAMSRTVDDKECLAFALKCLGISAQAQGSYQEAKTFLEESLSVSQAAGLDIRTGEALHCLGLLAQAEGNETAAKELISKSLSYAEKVQDPRWKAAALNNLGAIAREEGDYATARRYHELSSALRQGIGNKNGVCLCYLDLGLVEEVAGEHQAARHYFQQSLAVCQETGNKLWIAKALEGIARVAATLGQKQHAARLFGAADALRTAITAPMSPAEQKRCGEVKTALKKEHKTEWSKGNRWSLNETIRYALSFGDNTAT